MKIIDKIREFLTKTEEHVETVKADIDAAKTKALAEYDELMEVARSESFRNGAIVGGLIGTAAGIGFCILAGF